MPGIAIGHQPEADRDDPLASVMTVVPTTSRDFTRADRVTAVARIFQGGDAPPVPVAVSARILGSDDMAPVTLTATIPGADFGDARAASYRLPLPLTDLPVGLHLLSLTAELPSGRSVRRDVVFRLR
jgi:hypothetical protein